LILESKSNRDGLEGQIIGRSKTAKLLGWLFLIVSNIGMLFYIFLFAVSQDTNHQQAWGQSFALWLVLEIIIIGTLTVLIMHVWIPSLSMKDIVSIQKRLAETVCHYQEKIQQEKQRKQERSHKKTLRDVVITKQEAGLHTSKLDNDVDVDVDGNSEDTDDDDEEEDLPYSKIEVFNAAEYLFLSHAIAKLYSDLTIAKIILDFQSPWPKQSYQYLINISSSYEQATTGLSRSFSILLLFFLSSLLTMPLSIQDLLMNVSSTVGIGYIFLLHYQLYQISPGCIILPFFGCVLLVILGRYIHLKLKQKQQQAKRSQQRQTNVTVTSRLSLPSAFNSNDQETRTTLQLADHKRRNTRMKTMLKDSLTKTNSFQLRLSSVAKIRQSIAIRRTMLSQNNLLSANPAISKRNLMSFRGEKSLFASSLSASLSSSEVNSEKSLEDDLKAPQVNLNDKGRKSVISHKTRRSSVTEGMKTAKLMQNVLETYEEKEDEGKEHLVEEDSFDDDLDLSDFGDFNEELLLELEAALDEWEVSSEDLDETIPVEIAKDAEKDYMFPDIDDNDREIKSLSLISSESSVVLYV
jgi:hypothetical protein